MRRTLWITIGVFVCSMALCLISARNIDRVVDRALQLRMEAIEAMDAGDVQLAEQTMVQLASYLKDNQDWLEMLCEHEDLHDLKAEIIDAQASIEFGSEEDFYLAIYRFGEQMEHISESERLTLTNLY